MSLTSNTKTKIIIVISLIQNKMGNFAFSYFQLSFPNENLSVLKDNKIVFLSSQYTNMLKLRPSSKYC